MDLSLPYISNYPHKKCDLFSKIIPDFLTSDEVVYYSNKALSECVEEVYFANGLYRLCFSDELLANKFKDRLTEYLPNNIKNDFIVNDYFRMSKYRKGSFLPLHEDRSNYVNGYKSYYTVNIFLNTCIGGTSFWSQQSYGLKHDFTIPAIEGTAAVFDINKTHRGEYVDSEYKLLLRTDVMIPISN
jgi:hypothetical protein